jgi:hypothetical protein
MVLVDLLTDGEGEDIRWEVAYQKKDPKTGKNLLSFGVDFCEWSRTQALVFSEE